VTGSRFISAAATRWPLTLHPSNVVSRFPREITCRRLSVDHRANLALNHSITLQHCPSVQKRWISDDMITAGGEMARTMPPEALYSNSVYSAYAMHFASYYLIIASDVNTFSSQATDQDRNLSFRTKTRPSHSRVRLLMRCWMIYFTAVHSVFSGILSVLRRVIPGRGGGRV